MTTPAGVERRRVFREKKLRFIEARMKVLQAGAPVIPGEIERYCHDLLTFCRHVKEETSGNSE